jgi:hypothetical protein
MGKRGAISKRARAAVAASTRLTDGREDEEAAEGDAGDKRPGAEEEAKHV